MPEHTTLNGVSLLNDFTGLEVVDLHLTLPRIKDKKDVIRVNGLCYWKGPAWLVIAQQANRGDSDMYALFHNDDYGDRRVLVVQKTGVTTGRLTSEGLRVLRAMLPNDERELLELGFELGKLQMLSLATNGTSIY